MKRIAMWVIIGAIALSACGPSAADIQKAIKQTQAAQPTIAHTVVPPTTTETLAPTSTPLPPTDTPEPTATDTPTPEPTITPTPDLRVIKVDPQTILLQKDDLPPEGKYFLPNAKWISPHHNSEIIASWGVEEGQDYLEKTGRVDGWFVSYKRGTSTVNMPEEIYSNPVMYETAAGARLTVTDYNLVIRDPDAGWEYVEGANLDLGDINIVITNKELQSNGKNRVRIVIMFAYRNYAVTVRGWGWEGDVTLEFVEAAARKVLDKLMAAELSEP